MALPPVVFRSFPRPLTYLFFSLADRYLAVFWEEAAKVGITIALSIASQPPGCEAQQSGVPRVAEEDRGYHVKEERMAEHQPSKAGA